MTIRRLAESLLQGKPYFGRALQARQGVPLRHSYFLPIVRAQKRKLGSHPLRILEIGSWAGTSAVSWAHALTAADADGSVLCIDPWESYFDLTIDKINIYSEMNEAAADGSIFKLFQHNIATSGFDQISFIRGSSNNVMPTLADKSYDIIFLDGSHSYQNIAFDIAQARRLITDGGIICGDDLELQCGELPAAEHEAALASAAEWAWSNTAETSYHPGVSQAVGEAFGPVSVWDGLWAVRADAGQWREVELDLQGLSLPPHLAGELRHDEAETEAENEAAAQNHQVTKVGETKIYNIFKHGAQFAAIAKSTGPVDLFHEKIGQRQLGNIVLAGATLDEIFTSVHEAEATLIHEEVRLIEETANHNIMQYGNRFIAIAKSLGAVELFTERLGERELAPALLIGESRQDVVAKSEKILPEDISATQAAETQLYNIMQLGQKFVAIAKTLGPVNIGKDRVGDRAIGDFIRVSENLEEAIKDAELIEQRLAVPALAHLADTAMFNILQAGDRVIAAAKSLGPLNLLNEPLGAREIDGLILIGNSIDEIMPRVAGLEAERGSWQAELVAETPMYNVVQFGTQFAAVAKSLGPIALGRERIGERSIAKLILAEPTLDAALAQAAAAEREASGQMIVLIEETRDYNIFQAGDRFAAIAKSLGQVDLFNERVGERDLNGLIVAGSSLDDVKLRAQALETAHDEPAVELAGQTPMYNILQFGAQFAAVAKSLGPVAMWQERIGARSIGALILAAPTLDAALDQATSAERDSETALAALIDETRDYNIIEAGGHFAAVAKSLGPAELFKERLGERDLNGIIIAGSSLTDVKSRAQALEAAKDEPAVELAGQTPMYNILQFGAQFAAVAKSLGPVAMWQERIGARSIGALILAAPTLDAALDQATSAERDSGAAPAILIGETRDYNIVQAGGHFAAVAKSLGPAELFKERLGERDLNGIIIAGSSLTDVKSRAQALETANDGAS